MSRTTRVLGGAGVGYLHRIAIILLGLWLTPFLLRRVGQHEYGLWLVAGQLLGYLALLDLGVLAILPREVAALSGQADKAKAGADIAALLARVGALMRRWQLARAVDRVCARLVVPARRLVRFEQAAHSGLCRFRAAVSAAHPAGGAAGRSGNAVPGRRAAHRLDSRYGVHHRARHHGRWSVHAGRRLGDHHRGAGRCGVVALAKPLAAACDKRAAGSSLRSSRVRSG